jgi:hypothetical protein
MKVVAHYPSAKYLPAWFEDCFGGKEFLHSQQQQQCVPSLDLCHKQLPGIIIDCKLDIMKLTHQRMMFWVLISCLDKRRRCYWACNFCCLRLTFCPSYCDLHSQVTTSWNFQRFSDKLGLFQEKAVKCSIYIFLQPSYSNCGRS